MIFCKNYLYPYHVTFDNYLLSVDPLRKTMNKLIEIPISAFRTNICICAIYCYIIQYVKNNNLLVWI